MGLPKPIAECTHLPRLCLALEGEGSSEWRGWELGGWTISVALPWPLALPVLLPAGQLSLSPSEMGAERG